MPVIPVPDTTPLPISDEDKRDVNRTLTAEIERVAVIYTELSKTFISLAQPIGTTGIPPNIELAAMMVRESERFKVESARLGEIATLAGLLHILDELEAKATQAKQVQGNNQ